MNDMTTTAALSPALRDGIDRYEAGQYDRAYALFQTLADRDDPTAWFWLAVMQANGDGMPTDKAQGVRFCQRAAELGNIQAMTNLGVSYVQGEGVAADPETGLRWLCRAADAGDTGAQFNAATLLSAGKLVEKDLPRAVDYYRMAAEAGYFPAQARLGFCYRNGSGTARDRRKAFLWLTLAAQHGAGTAINMLEGLVAEMSPDELHDGQELVETWMERHGHQGAAPRFQVETK
ncbi:tetratricopeptide repeat protein [Salipiger pentaromativorans]|uniref:tetratricopeptide repeat protein n=1 Tax=Salipiger pentaromativorans TaxID=2943193 RepID=UPI0021573A9F|nr:tetratricopeptide repeat protein [Salipiger pentaromativorans]